jgi:predicted Zn-dependent peptidase
LCYRSAGDVSHSVLVDTVSSIEALNRNPDHSKDLQTSVQIVNEKKVNQLKRSTQQAHILLSKRVEGLESDDRYPLNVLSIIFGDGMSSSLYQPLREKHGLAYSAYSSLQLYSDCGGFYIYSAGEANKVEKILSVIAEEMTKLKSKNITLAEMKRAKEQLKTSVILDMESMSARMEALAKGELLNNEYEDVPFTIQAIEAVNESIIISMIEKYMQFDDWSKILILPK